jgi:hypothetical protein
MSVVLPNHQRSVKEIDGYKIRKSPRNKIPVPLPIPNWPNVSRKGELSKQNVIHKRGEGMSWELTVGGDGFKTLSSLSLKFVAKD